MGGIGAQLSEVGTGRLALGRHLTIDMPKNSSIPEAGWLIIAILAALSFSVAAEEAESGICEEQIAADLKARFDQEITKVDWSFESTLDGLSGLKSQALVYSDGCEGYHVYDVYATDHDCLDRAHYGQIPNYVRFRISEAGC